LWRIGLKRRKFLQQSAALTGAITAGIAAQSDNSQEKIGTARQDSPNVLFIMTDQQRYDSIAINGKSWLQTPHLDRLAKQSANFSHAYVQAPICTPSRACFFTGRYAHAHKNRVNYTELDAKETLLPKYLQQAGYRTSLVGKSHLYYKYPPTKTEAERTGYDFVDLHDGVPNTDPFSDYNTWRQKNDPLKEVHYRTLAKDVPELKSNLSPQSNPLRAAIENQYSDTAWTGMRTRERIRQLARSDQPFFLFSSFWKPHSPYEVHAPYDSMYNSIDFKLPRKETRESILKLPPHVARVILRNEYRENREPVYDMNRKELQWLYRSYYATVSHIDAEIGEILKTLDELNLINNTIIIFTSDHGDQLLEHGNTDKSVFFESSVHVPLMISYPNHLKPGRYEELVMSIDLRPTLFELLGLEEPYHCHGQSLLPLIGNSDKQYRPREYVYCEHNIPEVFLNLFNFEKGKGVMGIRHPEGKMIRSNRWKYNYYPKGCHELYDLQNDPGEYHNLSEDPAHKPLVHEMREHLLDWLITATETEQIAPRWLI
jgi:arylsulfatase A-like enzyme